MPATLSRGRRKIVKEKIEEKINGGHYDSYKEFMNRKKTIKVGENERECFMWEIFANEIFVFTHQAAEKEVVKNVFIETYSPYRECLKLYLDTEEFKGNFLF